VKRVSDTHNPESKPICPVVLVEDKARHGVSNELAVTVWFFWWNSKVTVSPICAVMFDGLYARMLGPPTMILWSTPVVGEVEGADDDVVVVYVVGTADPETVRVVVTVIKPVAAGVLALVLAVAPPFAAA